jgi:hypothetical protein
MHQFMRDINGNPFPDTPMGRIAGRWPGNETDEEIEQALNMTNERKNITQPADWWAAFEEQAKAEGLTLAAWLGEAAKAKLPPKVAKKLTERPPANRPPKAKD